MAIHPTEGTPMIYFDQLGTIGKHLHQIKEEEWWAQNTDMEAYEEYLATFDSVLTNDNDKAEETLNKYFAQSVKALKGILPKNSKVERISSQDKSYRNSMD